MLHLLQVVNMAFLKEEAEEEANGYLTVLKGWCRESKLKLYGSNPILFLELYLHATHVTKSKPAACQS